MKGEGEHGISNCTCSIHQNKNQSDGKEYRYQMIKLILPISLDRKLALDLMHHIDSICLKYDVEYLHKDYKPSKLNSIIKSLKIDPTIEIDEGERHQTLLSAADSLLLRYIDKGKTEERLKNFLSEINQQLCHPDDELEKIWKSDHGQIWRDYR